jgi:hypothetical protein
MVQIFLEYLIDPQLVKTCHAFMEPKLSLPCSQMELMQSQLNPVHTLISYLSILALIPLSPSGSLTFYDEHVYIFHLPCVVHTLQIMNLLIMLYSPSSCYILS